MPLGFAFGRGDGAADTYAPVATVAAGQLPIAAQTTLNALTTVLQSAVAVLIPTAAVAVSLPQSQAAGAPIVVTNASAGANSVTVFPPWNFVTAAVAGGKIFGYATGAPTANAGVVVAQGRTVLFYPHASGVDYTAVWGAVA